MKRFFASALAACIFFGAVGYARAVEFNAVGKTLSGYDYIDVNGFSGDGGSFIQGLDTQFSIIVSENVSATTFFSIEQTWGEANDNIGVGSGGAMGADGVNINTDRAYIDFTVPSTSLKIRSGIQGVGLPGAVAPSPVFDADVAAIVASQSVGDSNIAAFFARPFKTDTGSNIKVSTIDFFGGAFAADLGNVIISPYGLFANVTAPVEMPGQRIANNHYWFGTSIEAVATENLMFAFDGVYGKEHGRLGGYLVAGKVAYSTKIAVPALLCWYGSGNNDNSEGEMPSITDDAFAVTTLIGDGSMGPDIGYVFGGALGKWGIGLHLEELTVVEKLSHTVRITYARGTNHASESISDWGKDDSVTEVDLTSIYNLHEDVDVVIDTAYAITDFAAGEDKYVHSVFKLAVLVGYFF
ncbi:outer membrane homotrimeric porin [Halodesulfovibrio spirochaetisodalis]|uniref:Porin domain-containing protein n=1 Tax=Halodesulfovibrio spirochaetisodalis TaxID=1560234 RepID=A0A1B7XAP8_9BACT|nr:outer membrane homotrimeric porin [Halodesulfovibrio spirochaetisodalis]OBQ46380.1 hypothetical protein SP90_12665 [Halodesulfovibrio spirochaetisodalis]